MEYCFVIQPFDNGKYDKRFTDTYEKAVTECGIRAKRVDQDLRLQPIVSKIEELIKNARICLVEASENNPNVWLELGFALANSIPVIILCDEGIRSRLPFDIHNRPVIFYNSESKSDFETLHKRIVDVLKEELSGNSTQKNDSQIFFQPAIQTSDTAQDYKDYEIELIGFLASEYSSSNRFVDYNTIEKHMVRCKYGKVSANVALVQLQKAGVIEIEISEHEDFNTTYEVKSYALSAPGMEWVINNLSKFQVGKPMEMSSQSDDLPF